MVSIPFHYFGARFAIYRAGEMAQTRLVLSARTQSIHVMAPMRALLLWGAWWIHSRIPVRMLTPIWVWSATRRRLFRCIRCWCHSWFRSNRFYVAVKYLRVEAGSLSPFSLLIEPWPVFSFSCKGCSHIHPVWMLIYGLVWHPSVIFRCVESLCRMKWYRSEHIVIHGQKV